MLLYFMKFWKYFGMVNVKNKPFLGFPGLQKQCFNYHEKGLLSTSITKREN